jgi:hypothetical protein
MNKEYARRAAIPRNKAAVTKAEAGPRLAKKPGGSPREVSKTMGDSEDFGNAGFTVA